jgi:hypothetical protein
METSTQSELARIQSNIKYLESHFLNYRALHERTGNGGKCKYCDTPPLPENLLEICEAGTKQTQESARKNIEGAKMLISKLSEMSEKERELVLGFLNQCLQHHYY